MFPRVEKLITHEYRTTKTTAHKATCDELPADQNCTSTLHGCYVYFPGLISTSMVQVTSFKLKSNGKDSPFESLMAV